MTPTPKENPMTDHREQNSSCPRHRQEIPRDFLTEWEATSMKPTEDAMQNDEAERKLVRFADGIIPPGTVIGSFVADEHDDKAIIAEVITPAPEAAALIRTQAARIAELEAANRGLVRLSEAQSKMLDSEEDRAEAAEADVARLREAIRHAHDTLYELNPCNYDHDEVCRVNDASVEVILSLAPLLGEAHGKTPEWWADRAALQPKEEDV